jgi:hypothetical protein
MEPLESTEISQSPRVVSVVVMSLFTSNQLVVEGKSCHLGVSLSLELDPTFEIIHFAVSTCLFARVSHVFRLSLQVNPPNPKTLLEHIP